jgi:hypothetical protein
MAAEGEFPKADGDILFASEVNKFDTSISNTTGKVRGISSTYFDSLDGSALTNMPFSRILYSSTAGGSGSGGWSSGTIDTTDYDSIDVIYTGTIGSIGGGISSYWEVSLNGGAWQTLTSGSGGGGLIAADINISNQSSGTNSVFAKAYYSSSANIPLAGQSGKLTSIAFRVRYVQSGTYYVGIGGHFLIRGNAD